MLKKIAPIQFFAGGRLITKSQALTHLSLSETDYRKLKGGET